MYLLGRHNPTHSSSFDQGSRSGYGKMHSDSQYILKTELITSSERLNVGYVRKREVKFDSKVFVLGTQKDEVAIKWDGEE